MAVTYAEVFGVAQFLHVHAGSEAQWRSAVSRAYYSSMLCLRDRIEAVHGDSTTPENGIHSWLKRVLREQGRAHLRKLARDLETLHGFREHADYETQDAWPPHGEVGDILARAEAFNATVVGLPEAEIRRLRV